MTTIKDTPQSVAQLVELLQALGSAPRVRLLAAIARGNKTSSALAKTLGLSRPVIDRHIKLLEKVGCIQNDRGQARSVQFNTRELVLGEGVLDYFSRLGIDLTAVDLEG